MPETVSQCPLCSCRRSLPFDQREFHSRLVENRICQGCGLVFQSPRMTEIEAASFYATEYRLLQEGTTDPTTRNVSIQNARAESLYNFTQPVLSTIIRHLDIGCSIGILLQHFRRIYSNQAVGVEPGETHRMLAIKSGLTVYATLEDLQKAGETRFDFISMSHVLEHLPDPIATLIHLRESLLTPGGWLLLEVPNLYAHDSFEVAHLFAFSPHTVQEVLYKSGFEVVKFEKHGRPNSTLLPLFLTVLCHPAQKLYAGQIHPERWVMFKRRIGMFRRYILARLFPQRAWLVRG